MNEKKRKNELKAWLVRRGVSQISIARELGIVTSNITNWMAGRDKSSRIAGAFRALGCPERLLPPSARDDEGEKEAA